MANAKKETEAAMPKRNAKTTRSSQIQDNILILRSVYGKVGQKYYIQPCPDPVTGHYPDCVKTVNSMGDMILTDAERNSGAYFIPTTKVFTVEDGTSFNLDNEIDRKNWEAIKNCVYICEDRWAKDAQGNNLIDGTMDVRSTKPRYGIAELYIDRPGYDSQVRVTKRMKVINASNFILDDPRGVDGWLTIAKVLGAHMDNMPIADVQDYLLQIAEKDPDRIINVYTGDDLQLRIMFIDGRERKKIIKKNKAWWWEETLLGASDDSVITWMQDAKNQKILELMRRDIYPENYVSEDE